MLSKDVLKQRIEAARILRGVSQATLQQKFEADGLDKYAAGRVERGELDMQRVHRDAFCRHLGVPERWFSEPDVDVIVGLRLAARLTPDELRGELELLILGLDQAEEPGGKESTRSSDETRRRDPGAGGDPS
jgi:hypothetical protein